VYGCVGIGVEKNLLPLRESLKYFTSQMFPGTGEKTVFAGANMMRIKHNQVKLRICGISLLTNCLAWADRCICKDLLNKAVSQTANN
jgi:hypothetical protein